MKNFSLIVLLALAGWVVARGQDSLFQQTRPVYHAMTPPKAEDVAAVSGNRMMLDYGTGELDVNLQKEKVLEFLGKGVAQARSSDVKDEVKWGELARKSLSDEIMQDKMLHFDAQYMPDNADNRGYDNETIRAEGVLVTKQNQFFFWDLWNDRVLALWDDHGGSCLMVLGPDAMSSAPYLKLYWDRHHPDAEENKTGPLETPVAADVVAFSNRTDGRNVRFPVSRARVMRFLTQGKQEPWRLSGWPPRIEALAVRPEKLEAATLARIGNDDNDYAGQSANANGVLAMRDGRIIFWNLSSEEILLLYDSHHRSCALRLGDGKQSNEYPQPPVFDVNGRIYESTLPRDAVMKGPDWTPPAPPPLSNDGAMKIAWGELAKMAREKSPSQWRVTAVELVPLDAGGKKWCYKVSFIKPVDPEETGWMKGLPQAGFRGKAVIFIAMDGTRGVIKELTDAED